MNYNKKIGKIMKRMMGMLLSLSMIVGCMYGAGSSVADAAADETGILTITGEALTLNGDAVIDDSGKSCEMSDLKEIKLADGGKLIIDGTNVGNESLVINGQSTSSSIVVSSGATLICDSVNGTIENYGTIEANILDFSSMSGFTVNNEGVIAASSIVLKAGVNSGDGTYKVSDSLECTGYNSEAAPNVICNADTRIKSDGGSIYLKIDDSGLEGDYIVGEVDSTAIGLLGEEFEIIITEPDDVYLGTDYDLSPYVRIEEAYSGDWYIEYREAGADIYTTDKPKNSIGTYEFRVVAPTDGVHRTTYSEEMTYEINYLPLSECDAVIGGGYLSMEGLSNDIYVKDKLKLKPYYGYQAKTYMGDSQFADTIELTKADLCTYIDGVLNTDYGFYIKRKSDGATTNFISIFEAIPVMSSLIDSDNNLKLVFDDKDPEISGLPKVDGENMSISEGDVINADKVELTVTDEYLDKIVTPDGDYTRENGGVVASGGIYKADIVFESTVGETKDLYFIAYDMSGREISLGFKLKAALLTPEASVTVADITVGENITPILTTDSDGKDLVVYEYKKADEGEDAYSTNVPDTAGTYNIRATIPETESYKMAVCEGTFEILRKTPEIAKVTVADIYVGMDYEPVLTTDSDGKDKAVFEYKAQGAAEASYSVKKPTKAGTYMVRATIPATDIYEKATCECSYKIMKKKASAEVIISDQIVGVSYKPQIKTDSDGKDKTSYEYKKTGEDDDAYVKTKPTSAGTYVVRAVVPETDNYEKVTCEKEFELQYLKDSKATYIISGKEGKNGYYTSDVYLKAAKGYKISATHDGRYEDKILYDENIKQVYLKRISDGARTAAIKVERLSIDKVLPVISKVLDEEGHIVNVSDGDSVYVDKMTLTISDENLTAVKINGKEYSVDSDSSKLILEAENGTKQFNIFAEDIAGNEYRFVITLNATWMRTNIIPAGAPVPLELGKAYKLEEGSWTVSGDSTVYSGGGQFYVGSSGDYTFTRAGNVE